MKQIVTLSMFFVGAFFLMDLQAEENGDAVSLSGFADVQYQWIHQVKDPGFLLNDAALYLEKKVESQGLRFFLDLPFKGGLSDTSFDFAKEKAQAYIEWTVWEGLSFTFGQFDAIHGFEATDSWDLTFTTPGLMSLPVAHVGAMSTWAHESFEASALISNARDQGIKNGDNPEWGGRVCFDNEKLRASAGYLGQDPNGATGLDSFINLMAGFTQWVFTVDLEYDLRKMENVDWGTGAQAHVVVAVAPAVDLGFRADWLKKIPAAWAEQTVADYQIVQFTMGPQWSVTNDLKVKTDYTYNRLQANSGGSWESTHSANLALLAHF